MGWTKWGQKIGSGTIFALKAALLCLHHFLRRGLGVDFLYDIYYTYFMEIESREIRNYIAPDGHAPFKEWLDSQDKKVQTIALNRLNRVILGNFGDCKHLNEGVFELRIHYGPGYRVYFGDLNGVIVILLCGGTKRSPGRDIKRAKEYWLELRNRNYE